MFSPHCLVEVDHVLDVESDALLCPCWYLSQSAFDGQGRRQMHVRGSVWRGNNREHQLSAKERGGQSLRGCIPVGLETDEPGRGECPCDGLSRGGDVVGECSASRGCSLDGVKGACCDDGDDVAVLGYGLLADRASEVLDEGIAHVIFEGTLCGGGAGRSSGEHEERYGNQKGKEFAHGFLANSPV
ncbi:hypothetical protein [Arthrobacter sp. ISL-72]|uniref:hypothetical protein n=1 Tax=Arthrobacter sp. ISL-72 TaxID=2819114 RepID=UPI0037BF08C5